MNKMVLFGSVGCHLVQGLLLLQCDISEGGQIASLGGCGGDGNDASWRAVAVSKVSWAWVGPRESEHFPPGSGSFKLSESGCCRLSESGCCRLSESACFRLSEAACFRLSARACFRLSEVACFRLSEAACFRLPEAACFRLPEISELVFQPTV